MGWEWIYSKLFEFKKLIKFFFFLLISFWYKESVQRIRFIWKKFKNWVTQWEKKKDVMAGISQKRKAKEKKIVILTLWNIEKATRGKCCHFHISGLSFSFDENWITYNFPNIVKHFTQLCHFQGTSNFKSQQA